MNWSLYVDGVVVILLVAIFAWLLSLFLKDVSIVDSAWSLMFLASAIYYYLSLELINLKENIFFILVVLWALRLATHLTWRNWGEPEDRRYQDIRKKYSPNFGVKSLFIIFVFQAILAAVISLPIVSVLGIKSEPVNLGIIEYAAILIWLAGFTYESVADWQLAKFKSDNSNQNKVMNTGLWRNSRHPNYFGEFLIWWGFYLYAFSSGPWWIIVSPLLISWLLLKFSGVVMLEETIVKRRPDYQEYIDKTNAFFPGRVRS
ncbi:MAG: DUF1295 domain-containing protein [Gammaproteobacteria bacterium]|nr:DUF1295 domain-containing protein [Gammaproteobacteria bacterium]